MPPRDSFWGTVLIATVLCLVCSALVSSAYVVLKPTQVRNEQLDRKKNILLAAQLVSGDVTPSQVNDTYDESIRAKLIDLDTGEVLEADSAEADPEATDPIQPDGALPGFEKRAAQETVYEIVEDGKTVGYVLPIYGKGLWSTLYGFLALEADKQTVRGITYYKDGETPGLGGEINNPKWKGLWPEKKVYGESGEVELSVAKGKADPNDPYAVDGLSGATLTSKGVDQMVKYWLGPDAFGKYLAKD